MCDLKEETFARFDRLSASCDRINLDFWLAVCDVEEHPTYTEALADWLIQRKGTKEHRWMIRALNIPETYGQILLDGAIKHVEAIARGLSS